MMSQDGASDVATLLSRIQYLTSRTQRIEDDQDTRAKLLQSSRELTTSLEQPDEVVSLVAFSVSGCRLPPMLKPWLIDLGRTQYVREGSR
jgi:hypothetical protein